MADSYWLALKHNYRIRHAHNTQTRKASRKQPSLRQTSVTITLVEVAGARVVSSKAGTTIGISSVVGGGKVGEVTVTVEGGEVTVKVTAGVEVDVKSVEIAVASISV